MQIIIKSLYKIIYCTYDNISHVSIFMAKVLLNLIVSMLNSSYCRCNNIKIPLSVLKSIYITKLTYYFIKSSCIVTSTVLHPRDRLPSGYVRCVGVLYTYDE